MHLKSSDEGDILSLLAALNYEGHLMTFTCGVVWNEMVDEQASKGAAANQESFHRNYASMKAMIRRATRGGKYPMNEFAECMA